MNRLLFLFSSILLLLLSSCSSDLEKERKAYEESLESYQVVMYRGTKMMVRASSGVVMNETDFSKMLKIEDDKIGTATEVYKFVQYMSEVAKDTTGKAAENIDWMKLGEEIYDLRKVILETDEDQYPMFLDLAPDSAQIPLRTFLATNQLKYSNSMEHLFFGMLGTLSFAAPREINMYELSKVYKEDIGNNELWFLKELTETINISLCDWHYLAEDRVTRLIESYEKEPCSAQILSANSSQQINSASFSKAILASCYGLRAYERYKLSEKDDDKKEEAVNDAVLAVDLTNQSGLDIPELDLLAASLSALNKDTQKTKMYCERITNNPKSNENLRTSAQQMIVMIDQGDEDELAEISEKNLEDKLTIIYAAKDLLGLTLNKEEYATGMLEDAKDNPIETTFAFLKIYCVETKNMQLFLEVNKLEQKWNDLIH
ncbi:MAG: hypothetical protein K1X54_02750 [Flavobacteriales bacterium]|nr:hypothetical protein [Flavobacteriales bacterium]